MFLLKDFEKTIVSEMSFCFDDSAFIGKFKGQPGSIGLLVRSKNLLIYNALLEYLDYPGFTPFKEGRRLILDKLSIIPNIKDNSVDFLSLSDNLPNGYITGFEAFKSCDVEAVILYSILTADPYFSIARFKRQIRKDEESNLDFNFTIDTLEQFMELSRG